MRERPDYYYDQSAVIPYRMVGGRLEILVITSRKKKRWVIPKGIIEADLPAPHSAAKEALEEAGVEGAVHHGLAGSYQYEKWGGICSVDVFALRVERMLESWLEDFRDREWVDLEEAVARMQEPALKEILQKFPAYLKRVG